MTAVQTLGCQSCGRAITPCLVCSHPFPASRIADPSSQTCGKCGVLNPLGDKHRHLLGLPPALALPPAMVRRAQVARIGRRAYTLAKHAHYMHLRSSLNYQEEREGEEPDPFDVTDPISPGPLPTQGPPVAEIFASVEEGHPLTFWPYMQDVDMMDRGAIEAGRYVPFSDSESPEKRMSVTIPASVNPLHLAIFTDLLLERRTWKVPIKLENLKEPKYRNFLTSPRRRGREESQVEPAGNKRAKNQHDQEASIRDRADGYVEHHFTDLAKLGETVEQIGNRPMYHKEPEVQAVVVLSGVDKPSKDPSSIDGVLLAPHTSHCIAHINASSGQTDRPYKFFEHDFSTQLKQEEAAAHFSTGSRDVSDRKMQVINKAPGDGEPPNNATDAAEVPTIVVSTGKEKCPKLHQGEERVHNVVTMVAASRTPVEHPYKYFEHDYYAPTNPGETTKQLGRKSDSYTEFDMQVPSTTPGETCPAYGASGSEEIPTRREERPCTECGQSGLSTPASGSKGDEAGLIRCCSQLLELHCAHVLWADLHGPPTYPLCGTTFKTEITNNSNKHFHYGCQSYASKVIIDMLRSVHAIIFSSTQESTSEEVKSLCREVERALTAAGRYIQERDQLAKLQRLVTKAKAASSQAVRDVTSFAERGLFPLATGLLTGLLEERKQKKLNLLRVELQDSTALLLKINAALAYCYQLALEVSQTPSTLESCIMDDSKPVVEALRVVVPQWLRLYHDVAHGTGHLSTSVA